MPLDFPLTGNVLPFDLVGQRIILTFELVGQQIILTFDLGGQRIILTFHLGVAYLVGPEQLLSELLGDPWGLQSHQQSTANR